METIFGIFIAIGLAAACGFRIFVPPLIAGVAHMMGWVDLAGGMAWIGSPVAVTCFAVATCLEIAAYFIPVVSNVLDVIATPAAMIAGAVVAASVVGRVAVDMGLSWSLREVANVEQLKSMKLFHGIFTGPSNAV